jgi:hypothetical protein
VKGDTVSLCVPRVGGGGAQAICFHVGFHRADYIQRSHRPFILYPAHPVTSYTVPHSAGDVVAV